MRNYFKVWATVVTWTSVTFPGSTFYIAAFGTDEDDLFRTVTVYENQVRANTPNAVFTHRAPQITWFLLNHENFVLLLNCNSAGAREQIWNGMELPQIPNGIYNRWLEDITATKYTGQSSPRMDWSHGH